MFRSESVDSMGRVCYQINLQTTFGGGEVFTRFFSEALVALGWEVILFVHRAAAFWGDLEIQGIRLERVLNEEEIWPRLPVQQSLVVTQTVVSEAFARRLRVRHQLVGLIHMPLYERDPAGLKHYNWLLGVSRHVIASVWARGYKSICPEPLYGVADLRSRGRAGGELRARSSYEWDRRKFRDRVLGAIEPWIEPLRTRPRHVRRPGVSIGIVSRLTPIKQFPLMFSILAARLVSYPMVNLEVFGAGGYATVRDLRRSLAPMNGRARYWGYQPDVAGVYPKLDYVISGLPEKEAMGLNLIEAQQCGTPVLAVDAPPFTETVVDRKTGYLFRDPREDAGDAFETLLSGIVTGRLPRPDPRASAAHLAQFSELEFQTRVRIAFGHMALDLPK